MERPWVNMNWCFKKVPAGLIVCMEQVLQLQEQGKKNKQTIILNLAQPQPVGITLLDISGREVQTIFNGQAQEGENRFQTDLTVLKAGIYFCRIRKDEGIETIKVIKN